MTRGDPFFNNTYVDVWQSSDVYLGIAGRELRCRTADNRSNFQAGSTDQFVFGQNANVLHARLNDPQIFSMAAASEPVYIRFQPFPNLEDEDDWCVERAEMVIEGTEGDEIRLCANPRRQRLHVARQGNRPHRPPDLTPPRTRRALRAGRLPPPCRRPARNQTEELP